MSLHKARPVDTLQSIVSSFRHFERKLDKLQDDVSYHGQTLSELRVMIANISNDVKVDVKGVSKTTGMDSYHLEETIKTNRKNAVQPLPSKVATKNFQGQKFGIKPSKDPEKYRAKKLPPCSKTVSGAKRVLRPRKGEAPRKLTTLRPKKSTAKKPKSP